MKILNSIFTGLIIVLLLAIIGGSYYFIYRNGEVYIKNYFDAKQQKLELMKESGVDSMLYVIKTQKDSILKLNKKITTDSVSHVSDLKSKNILIWNMTKKYNKMVVKKDSTIKNYVNLTEHLSNIIDNLNQ